MKNNINVIAIPVRIISYQTQQIIIIIIIN